MAFSVAQGVQVPVVGVAGLLEVEVGVGVGVGGMITGVEVAMGVTVPSLKTGSEASLLSIVAPKANGKAPAFGV